MMILIYPSSAILFKRMQIVLAFTVKLLTSKYLATKGLFTAAVNYSESENFLLCLSFLSFSHFFDVFRLSVRFFSVWIDPKKWPMPKWTTDTRFGLDTRYLFVSKSSIHFRWENTFHCLCYCVNLLYIISRAFHKWKSDRIWKNFLSL